MPRPNNPNKYANVKKRVYGRIRKHPAYRVKDRQRTKAKQIGYTIKSSNVKNKKISVIDKDGDKVADIGALGYNDYATYLQTTDKATADKKRQAYLKRHSKDPKTKDGKPTPSRLADKILWN